MSVTLHLKPEVEAGLKAKAHENGMLLEDYLLNVVAGTVLSNGDKTGPVGQGDRAIAVRRMLEFGEKYGLSSGEPVTRAILHEGHRF
jgi:hypothetical protein